MRFSPGASLASAASRQSADVRRAVRLLICATHPIQYHAPLFRRLARNSAFETLVAFAHRPTAVEQGEGFGIEFNWDVDLTNGYRHVWLGNHATSPSVARFWGCNAPEIDEITHQYRPDALLVMGWNSRYYIQALRAARRAGVPVLVRGDSHLGSGAAGTRLIKELLYRWAVRQFDVCLAVGQRSAEYFRYYGARRIVPCPHFVDNEWFASEARGARAQVERGELRRRWGCGERSVVFLLAGKIDSNKRPLDALEALRLCRLENKTAELLVVGEGPLRQAMAMTAEQAGLPIHFAGFVNQSLMPQVYAASDVLLLPSGRETWGLVANEAMACGVPVIASDRAGCVPDLMDGGAGLVYRCGDVRALARLMVQIAGSSERLDMLSRRAQAIIGRFTPERAEYGVLEGVARLGLQLDL